MNTNFAPSAFSRFAQTLLLISLSSSLAAQAPIVQPGAPGEPTRSLNVAEATEIAKTAYSPADVQFMRDMIPHHHQAIEMSVLVAERTNNPDVIDAAGRIQSSQGDEIEFCRQQAAALGVSDKITFHGQIPRDAVDPANLTESPGSR